MPELTQKDKERLFDEMLDREGRPLRVNDAIAHVTSVPECCTACHAVLVNAVYVVCMLNADEWLSTKRFTVPAALVRK